MSIPNESLSKEVVKSKCILLSIGRSFQRIGTKWAAEATFGILLQ